MSVTRDPRETDPPLETIRLALEGAETELYRDNLARSGYPQLHGRVTQAGHEIRLHLTATLPLPRGARAQPPLLAGTLFQRQFSDLLARAGEFLGEFLRPGSGDQP